MRLPGGHAMVLALILGAWADSPPAAAQPAGGASAAPSCPSLPDGSPIPAFRGAMGGGALSEGGRGGRVIPVTNLDDAGPGSLRDCVTASGPRTCVFQVSGAITLRSPLRLTAANSYLTVAGQTAPGGGIAIAGGAGGASGSGGFPDSDAAANNLLVVDGAHDVTIRYVRLWRGYNRHAAAPSHQGACGANLTVYRTRRLILDHVTAVWAMDKSLSIWAQHAGDVQEVTVGYSISGEGIGAPSCNDTNVLTGGDSIPAMDEMTDVDLHHDYLLSSSHRFPLFKSKSGRLVNNVLFNWGTWATGIGGGASVDIVGNYYAPGPSSAGGVHPVQVNRFDAFPGCTTCGPSGTPSLYLANNVGPGQPVAGARDWDHLVAYTDYEGGGECSTNSLARRVGCGERGKPGYHPLWIPDGRPPARLRWKRDAPLPAATAPGPPGSPPVAGACGIRIRALTLVGNGRNLLERLLRASAPEPVGASRRLDCRGHWVVNRDASDARMVRYLTPGGGAPRSGQRRVSDYQPGGFPSLGPRVAATDVCPPGQADNARCRCPDRDGDGIPDAWERAHGLDPDDPSDGPRRGRDGRSNLEHFLDGD